MPSSAPLSRYTLIAFITDNGWDETLGPRWFVDGPRGKRSIYEMGFRTPIIVSWPGRVAAGEVRDELVLDADRLRAEIADAESDIADLLQGTLDMLVLKTLQLEAQHGWGISQRIQQMSRDVLQVNQGSLYPALYRLENGAVLELPRDATDR